MKTADPEQAIQRQIEATDRQTRPDEGTIDQLGYEILRADGLGGQNRREGGGEARAGGQGPRVGAMIRRSQGSGPVGGRIAR